MSDTISVRPLKMHTGVIENSVAMLLNYRVYTIVPNVSWGLGLHHECDMLALDKDGRFTEIEIKISMSDLRADFRKKHGHRSKYISRLVYAIPDVMVEKSLELIPRDCGIISVHLIENYGVRGFEARWVRRAKHNRNAEMVPQSVINKFHQLGCMRIWSLKQKLYNKCEEREQFQSSSTGR